MTVPTVSVVICCYTEERIDCIEAAVESVQDQSASPLETIVVVDNNDALLSRLRRELTSVQVVASRFPKGLSGARNTGIELAKGDVVAFLDDDAVANTNWLASLSSAYIAPDVIAAGGTISPRFPGERPGFLPAEFDWVVGCTFLGLPRNGDEVRNLIGANMSFRAASLEGLGGFSDGLGRGDQDMLGGEETELCIRLRAAHPSGRIVMVDEAEVAHRVHSHRTRFSYFVRRCFDEGRSKASLTSMQGTRLGLASEATYVTRTLPRAVLKYLAKLQFARAASIVIGLGVTVAGFATEKLRQLNQPTLSRS